MGPVGLLKVTLNSQKCIFAHSWPYMKNFHILDLNLESSYHNAFSLFNHEDSQGGY